MPPPRPVPIAWLMLAAGALLAAHPGAAVLPCQAPGQQQPPLPRVIERVEVSRVLIDARVVDDHGQPIPDLTAADFRVKIDGTPVRVESAHWVGGSAPEPAGPPAASALPPPTGSPLPPQAGGRLVVFLFQKDMEPSRIVGLMRMLIETGEFLDSLGPDDRVAVLSFDYKLKIWLDFTNRRDRVLEVFQRGILFRNPPPVEPVLPPSLMSTLDIVKANRAYSMEEALALLGQALEPLPGAKSVVLVGHGFGRLYGTTLHFEDAYGEARRALQAARASVFCLDVTQADGHTLEAGLQMTAADTGGFFERTHLFPGRAMARLAGALAGHYVLFVETVAAPAQRVHEISVELTRRKGNVLAKRTYVTTP